MKYVHRHRRDCKDANTTVTPGAPLLDQEDIDDSLEPSLKRPKLDNSAQLWSSNEQENEDPEEIDLTVDAFLKQRGKSKGKSKADAFHQQYSNFAYKNLSHRHRMESLQYRTINHSQSMP
jgi:hypothetical protein